MDLPWGFYLGWDWNPVIFFIVLGLSVALAMVMKGWRVLWIFPALVLYQGLLWEIPDGWSDLFRWVFWLSILAVIVTAVLPGPTRIARFPTGWMIALVLWCVLLWLLGPVTGLISYSPERETPPLGNNTIDRCLTIDGRDDGGVVQKHLPDGYDVDAYGICTRNDEEIGEGEAEFACPDRLEQRSISDEETRRFVREGVNSATTARSWDKLGTALLHDARLLRQTAIYLNVPDIPPLGRMLRENGECLSAVGLELHDDLTVVGKATLKSRFGRAPSDGLNSWVDKQGNLVVRPERGITGNRKALVFIDADGNRRYILVRCGNPVF